MSLKSIFFRCLCWPNGVLPLAATGLLLSAAQAATFRVDDTGTRIALPVTPMRWQTLVPGRAQDNTAQGNTQVALRLNVSSWVGRRARLYITLAPGAGGSSVRASWRTGGRLLPGTVLSGGRALVFEGAITSATLEETLDMTLTADGSSLEATQSLQFNFEIEMP